jgi:hypothetical protein
MGKSFWSVMILARAPWSLKIPDPIGMLGLELDHDAKRLERGDVETKIIESLGYVPLSIHTLKNTLTPIRTVMRARSASPHSSQGYTGSVTKTNSTPTEARLEVVDPRK